MKKDQGITLISLVVTIIVLIILAGISINLILGQDGIINKAKQAKQNMELATIEEQEQLNEIYNQMGTQINSSSSIGNGGDELKINDFKIAIADYIAEAGGIRPEQTDDTETFGERIKGIVKEVTKDASASAENISSGKTAWINGELVTGTGADVENAYNNGYAEGLKQASNSNAEIQYTYHTHTSGCYTTENVSIVSYSEREGGYYKCYSCGRSSASFIRWSGATLNSGRTGNFAMCEKCGAYYSSIYPDSSNLIGSSLGTYNKLTCPKTTSTIESAQIIFK